jgi:catechol 2,3-dioxygenase-like lactoylglutathione lyase family enzyme
MSTAGCSNQQKACSVELTTVDHIAIAVSNIQQALRWYRGRFEVETLYEDATWAMLRFGNVNLALVLRGQYPPHIAIERPDAQAYGALTKHRDGTASIYVHDPFGNVIEVLKSDG